MPDLDAAIRAAIAHPPTVTTAMAGDSAVLINGWASAASAALLAVLDLHGPTYYDDRIEYERREEPVFAADGTPRGVVEVRGDPLPPDWCAPCAEVTPCDEVRAIAKALGIEVA